MTASYSDRLAKALAHAGKTRAELAACLRRPDGTQGVSVSAVGQVLAGKSKSLTAENSALAARFLGVNHLWLAVGIGLMADQPVPVFRAEQSPAKYGPSESEVLSYLRNMLRHSQPEFRPAIADLLAAWARDGGREDRTAALCSLLQRTPVG